MTRAERKLYMRRWYLLNRHKRKQFYRENRAEILRKARDRYRNPEVKKRKALRDKRYHAAHREARNKYAAQWRRRHPERMYELSLLWRERNPEKFRKIQARHRRRWVARNPEKNRAHQIVADALRMVKHGKKVKPQLVRPKKCSLCHRSGRIEAHHPNYSKPLDVLWVCHTCHRMLEGRLGARHKGSAVRLDRATKQ